MVEMIDGPMIMRLIENKEEFDKFVEEKFHTKNKKNEENPTSNDDHVGFVEVDLEEYKAELRDMMMAVAQGIGNTPVNVMVEEGSFTSKAYEVEVSRIRKEEDEKKKKMIEEEKENGYLNSNYGNNEKVKSVVAREKKLKKKSSFNLMNFCACSGKQFVVNDN